MRFINTVSSFTAMNYLVHHGKSAIHLFNPVTNACRYVRYGWMLSRTICTTSVITDTHYPSIHLVDRRLSSIKHGGNRSYSTTSPSSGSFKKYLPVIGTSALLFGVLAFRQFVNAEPDSENLLKDARKRVAKMSKPQSLSDGDNASDLVSPARSGLSSSSPKSSTFKKEIDKEQKGFTEEVTLSAESVIVQPDQKNEKNNSEFKNAESDIKCIDLAKSGFPSHVRYLIVGAGTAGMAAARAIRASDPTARVLMLAGAEPSVEGVAGGLEPPPYLRPALSKELWRRSSARESKILQTTGDMRRHSWLYYEPESFFMEAESINTAEFGGVALLRGDPAVSLDPDRQTVHLKSGRQISYDRCLLATGGRPKQLPHSLEQCSRTNTNLLQSGHISYFRTLADYRNLRKIRDKLQKTGGRIAIVGGGFLGSELAVSLLTEPSNTSKNTNTESEIAGAGENQAKREPTPLGVSVMHIFQESAPMGQVLPPCLASAISRFEANRGADLRPSAELIDICLVPDELTDSSSSPNTATVEWTDNRPPLKALQTVAASQVNQQETESHQRIRLRLRRNDDIFSPAVVEDIEVDHLVCAIGLEANTEMASSAGLELDHINGGFLVNAELESRGGVYVAGDAASYWDPVLACRRRVEHLNFAEETGTLAGKNMAASLAAQQNSASMQHKGTRYHYQSSMWSNLGKEVNWDAVGLVDSRNLLTRSFFSPGVQKNSTSVPDSEFGSLSQGVVFYLTPKERRLIGILLWNLPEFIYMDKEIAAPSRLSIARSILAERRVIGQSKLKEGEQMPLSEEQELQQLATEFDIYGELEDDYAQLKAYIETKQKELDSPTSEDTGNASDTGKRDGETT